MIQHLGKIEHLAIYWDPEMEHDQVLVGGKGKELESGLMFIPNKNFEMIEGVTMDEVKYKHKFEDYNFMIGSFSTLEPYNKVVYLLKTKNDRRI